MKSLIIFGSLLILTAGTEEKSPLNQDVQIQIADAHNKCRK